MKKALAVIAAVFLSISYLHAYTAQNPTNHFDVSLAGSQSLASAVEIQGIFNMNESFYVGVRFTGSQSVYYYSKISRTSQIEHVLGFSNIALLLGVQSGIFNERFRSYLNIMPGFGFGERQTGTRPDGSIFSTAVMAVTKTEAQSFFAPAVEFGFNCSLTDNLIISLGWETTLISVSDMAWEQNPWLIKLSEKDALGFSIPARLAWRF